MEVKYAKKDYINLFLVDSIALEGSSYYGYTTFPDDSVQNCIFLSKEYLINVTNANYRSKSSTNS